MSLPNNHHPASFRDPSGYVFEKDGQIFRFVSTLYREHYDHLLQSGLYQTLIKKHLMLPFTEVEATENTISNCYKILHPQKIPFLNYAWEWSFEQLKDAALATLRICKMALEKGMILKDATHLNIQFVEGKPQLIDILSLELYKEGAPWIAYRQFCECFLNPLLLAAYNGMEVHQLLLAHPEGVNASYTARLLPFTTKFKASVFLHVHLHARLKNKNKGEQGSAKEKPLSKQQLKNILQSLEDCISKLKLPAEVSTWSNYYEETIISNNYLSAKKTKMQQWLQQLNYTTVCDFGANEGEFSKLCKQDAFVVSTDFDSRCIGSLHSNLKKEKIHNILPLVLDITQPSPAMGWDNKEQTSFFSRKQFDLGFALALIHHLTIGKNIPFEMVASLFAKYTQQLIIEFVPKSDPKVTGMLSTREDIFSNYTIEEFEHAFSSYFTIIKKEPIEHSERTLYLMQKK